MRWCYVFNCSDSISKCRKQDFTPWIRPNLRFYMKDDITYEKSNEKIASNKELCKQPVVFSLKLYLINKIFKKGENLIVHFQAVGHIFVIKLIICDAYIKRDRIISISAL